MVFHEWGKGIKPVGIVQHRNIMVDLLSNPSACWIRRSLLAKVGDHHAELVVFRQMATACVVSIVGDVEDEIGAALPLLHREEPGLWKPIRHSPHALLCEKSQCSSHNPIGCGCAVTVQGTPLGYDDQHSEWL